MISKMFFLIISTYLLFFFFSCGKKTILTETDSAGKIVPIEVNKGENLFYSQVFDRVEYVKLETNDNVLIKDVTKVICRRDTIYILDKRMQTVFCFDKLGKCLWKINDQGAGPNEYMQLMDFDIDNKSGKIYLLSRMEKILIYNSNGIYLEQIHFVESVFSMNVNDDYLYFYTGNLDYSSGLYPAGFSLLIRNIATKEVFGRIPLNGEFLDSYYSFNSSGAFCNNGDGIIRFFMPFSNKIYSLHENNVQVEYTLDFGKYTIPKEYFLSHSVEDLKNTGFMYGLNLYWENHCYLGFNVKFDKEDHSFLIYSKEKNKLYHHFYDDIAHCFPQIQQVTNEYLIGSRNIQDLHVEYNFSKKDKAGTILEKIISETSEDDNPVLFFYYLKK